MDKVKNVLSWIWEKMKAGATWLYKEFRQYPQYGWPTVAFIAGWVVGKFV
jgi:hypothetical protein